MGRIAAFLLAAGLAMPAAAQNAADSTWEGEWSGLYRCAQGDTGLTLRLRPRPDGSLDGLFHFWPLRANPAAAEGCFAMRATPDPANSASLDLRAGRWLLQPSDYVTVDLEGQLGKDGGFRGSVRGPGCDSFELRRAAAPRPLPAACAGPVAAR